VRCRACSALPDFEDLLGAGEEDDSNKASAICTVVSDQAHFRECIRIRHEVFVREQGLFSESDADVLDPVSFHILAMASHTPVGTVRITPIDEDTWLGSRLAVYKPFRKRWGSLLVRKAEEEVRIRGGRRFIAYIQLPKVAFFERCGWRCIRKIPDYHGRPHMLMEASLWPRATEPQDEQSKEQGERVKGRNVMSKNFKAKSTSNLVLSLDREAIR
jgi:putative N-acetyltransferase (TIGR04045 family)